MIYSTPIIQVRSSKFYISILQGHECTHAKYHNYKCNALPHFKIAFIELHIGIIYLAYTDRYHKQ